VTVILDAVKRSVIDVEEGRGKDTVEKFREKLELKGGKAEQVKAVTSDMSTSYVPAIAENFPEA
jgi:transposase